MNFEQVIAQVPLIAILRGVRVSEAVDVARVLLASGIKVVEVPLNSPQAVESIEAIRTAFKDQLVVGAGTVSTLSQLETLHAVDCQIVLSPHCDVQLIGRALELGMIPVPGVVTPTEIYQALAAGADWLKVFPSVSCGPDFFRQVKAVLPERARLVAVGGITAHNLSEFRQAGAFAVGVGSQLYSPGKSLEMLALHANDLVSALNSDK